MVCFAFLIGVDGNADVVMDSRVVGREEVKYIPLVHTKREQKREQHLFFMVWFDGNTHIYAARRIKSICSLFHMMWCS